MDLNTGQRFCNGLNSTTLDSAIGFKVDKAHHDLLIGTSKHEPLVFQCFLKKQGAIFSVFSTQLSHIGLALLFVVLLFVTINLAARARRHGGACQRSIMKKRFVYLSIAFAPSPRSPLSNNYFMELFSDKGKCRHIIARTSARRE